MQGIKSVQNYLPNVLTQRDLAAAIADNSGSDFQLPSVTSLTTAPTGRGVAASAYPSLGSQTMLALLQVQDLSLSQTHGHAGGHGMHLSASKTLPGIEAEEASSSETTLQSTSKKKMITEFDESQTSDEPENDDQDTQDKDKQRSAHQEQRDNKLSA